MIRMRASCKEASYSGDYMERPEEMVARPPLEDKNAYRKEKHVRI